MSCLLSPRSSLSTKTCFWGHKFQCTGVHWSKPTLAPSALTTWLLRMGKSSGPILSSRVVKALGARVGFDQCEDCHIHCHPGVPGSSPGQSINFSSVWDKQRSPIHLLFRLPNWFLYHHNFLYIFIYLSVCRLYVIHFICNTFMNTNFHFFHLFHFCFREFLLLLGSTAMEWNWPLET